MGDPDNPARQPASIEVSMAHTKRERLDRLYREIQNDPDYRNDKMGSIFVPGSGSLDAQIVFVGEAPGREEELQQQPFVGAAGRNLDILLKHAGLDRNKAFITNLTKYRPLNRNGGNRRPSARESRRALPYLWKELEIILPQWIVCLGSAPAAALLEMPSLKMSLAHGKTWHHHPFTILVVYHPSPFNFNNRQKRQALTTVFKGLRAMTVLESSDLGQIK